MTVNERIRYLRKDILHLNQRRFANDLGMAQTGVSTMERDGATITDRVIRSICLAYNINETWLRDGTGPMYLQPPTFSLEDFLQEHKATELDLEILKAYFELDPEIRKTVLNHFKSRLSEKRKDSSIMDGIPGTPEEFEKKYPPIENTGKINKTAGNL